MTNEQLKEKEKAVAMYKAVKAGQVDGFKLPTLSRIKVGSITFVYWKY